MDKKLILFFIIAILIAPLVSSISDYGEFSFAIYSDTHGGDEYHQKIATLIEDKNPNFVIHVGDFVDSGCNKSQWEDFLNAAENICRSKDSSVRCDKSNNWLDTTFYPVMGNHDLPCLENYFSIFPFLKKDNQENRYYSFTHSNSYFIILDSNDENEISDKNSNQNVWLKNELKKSENYKFKFVFFHHPPHSMGGGHGPNKEMQKFWIPILDEYDVDIAFNGHNHIYARIYQNGINYISVSSSCKKLYGVEKLDRSGWFMEKAYRIGLFFYNLIKSDEEKRFFTAYSESVQSYIIVNIKGGKLMLETYDYNGTLIDRLTD